MPVSARLRSFTRSFTRSRALSIAVMVMPGLGVAALTTTFAMVNAALVRAPPFHDAERVAMLYLERHPTGEASRQERWSFERIRRLEQTQQSFEQIASYSPTMITLAGDTDAEPVRGEFVSTSYFPLLRADALRGRVFLMSEDDAARASPVAVIGHALWARRLARAPIAGQTIRVNGVPLAVIGVLPEGFHGLSGRAELWIPRTMAPQLTYAEYLTTNQNFISVVGRLQPDVALSTAQGELAALGATINRELPSDPDAREERVRATAVPINEARIEPTMRKALLILFGAVVLLHLLACANATNLLLGRAAQKHRESALRIALGSSAGRLFLHIFGEGFAPAVVGGLAGVGLAWRVSSVLAPPTNAWAPRNFYGSLAPFDTPAFGLGELAFGIMLALVSAFLVAVPPALSALRIDITAGIRSGARGISGGTLSVRRPTARGVIVGMEAALAMLLAVPAGLLVDSFQRMRQASIGIDAQQVLTFWVIPSEARVLPATAPSFVARLLDAMASVPGVVSASVDGGAPLSGTASSTLFIEGRTISATAARRFWPRENPLGKRVWFGGGSSFNSPDSSAEIVGIVGDVVYTPLDQQPNFASFYTPYAQFTYASRIVFLRTAGDPLSVVRDVRNAVATVDPDLALRDIQPLTDIVSGSWARHRFDALLFSGFGIAALILAASGIFAVLAHAVTSRTREFGVRIALGASRGRVLRLVLREGMTFPAIGLLAGMLASVATTRLLRSSLYEISPLEPRVLVATALLLSAVAAAACLAPAWRATRADPMEALRAD